MNLIDKYKNALVTVFPIYRREVLIKKEFSYILGMESSKCFCLTHDARHCERNSSQLLGNA